MLDVAEAPTLSEIPRTNLLARDRRPVVASPKPAPRAALRLVGPEHREAIAQAIEELRPRLQQDGGDCELVDIVDGIVRVRLAGACVGCSMASMTIAGVRMRLTEKLGFFVRLAPV